jgi:hypothetical protein
MDNLFLSKQSQTFVKVDFNIKIYTKSFMILG